MRKLQTFKFDVDLLEILKKLAAGENRAFNNYVETALFQHVKQLKERAQQLAPLSARKRTKNISKEKLA